MISPLLALALAASADAATPLDSVTADSSARPHRIVREFAPVVVEGGRFSDPASLETVHSISREALRRLAVDRFTGAIALRAGVVATGEQLHVRGGRSGELAFTVEGVPLNEPGRGSAMEVPLFAVRSADLLSGGLDADHAGSLAGEVEVHTETPTPRPGGAIRWMSDGNRGTGFQSLHARGSVPVPGTALGIVAAGETRFDDLGYPSLRSQGDDRFLGARLRWRQDNRMLAWAKLAPLDRPQRASFEVLASRTVQLPYNPMFDFDGWVQYRNDYLGNPHGFPYATSDRQVDSTYFRYRAADHLPMTEDRRLAAIASAAIGGGRLSQRVSLGWIGTSTLTSVGLRRDPGYITDRNRVVFGLLDHAATDPFHAYFGDVPLYRESESARWLARYDALRPVGRHHFLRFGAGGTYEWSRLWEFDDALPEGRGFDTLRTYHGRAPGAFAYAQHRFELGGLVWNAGLRVQSFTAGANVRNEYESPSPTPEGLPGRTFWTWCPRLGFAYPVSVQDVFSLAYSRECQDPPRDVLQDNRYTAYNRHPFGQRDVAPAQVVSWQAALKHILDPEWSLQIGVFWRDAYGQPGARAWRDPVRRVYFLRYDSADESHAGGVEVALARERPGLGRLELSYTFMNAWGTQSSIDGLAYGLPYGERPDPIAEHPLDWDEEHSVAFTGDLHARTDLDVSWSTRIASGRPWTPLYRGLETDTWPFLYADQSLLNSRRLAPSENTNLAVRWRPRRLAGATVLLSVTNLFDNRTANLATLSGFPNPIIGTLYDEYSAHRTETGQGGGAFWTDVNGDGRREWVRVKDPRLSPPPRSLRLGFEIGR